MTASFTALRTEIERAIVALGNASGADQATIDELTAQLKAAVDGVNGSVEPPLV